MWVNIIGFVVSLIFYVCIQQGVTKPLTAERASLEDSLIKVHAVLCKEISDLREQQRVLFLGLENKKNDLARQESQIRTQREKIHFTMLDEWDSLSTHRKTEYTSELILKLKKQSK